MILTILKSYFALFLSIGIGSLVIFLSGLYLIFRKPASSNKPVTDMQMKADHYSHHISSIAGDDIITTQLDLARAYIETDRKKLAAEILEYVMQQGNPNQQREAQQLMNNR
jgi:FimV-like protein